MIDDLKRARIERFMNDLVTSDAVYEAVRESFLGRKGAKEIQILAAERLAIDLLSEAWKELKKFRAVEEDDTKITKQVGL